MSIKTWFADRKFFTKVILIYVIFMVIPMFSVTVYNYANTRHILLEGSYDDIRENAEVMENSFRSLFQKYDTIIDELRSDRALNTYLSLDYTNRSYEDLAYYSQTTLDNLMVLYPEIQWIHFYSNNDTLPGDDYYFFQSDQIEESILEETSEKLGQPVASGSILGENGDEIIYIADMNYFMSRYVHNYVALGIEQQSVTLPLQMEREDSAAYLVDKNGIVLASSSDEMTGKDFSDVIEDWSELNSDEIISGADKEKDELLYLKKDLDADMTLIITVDQTQMLREISRTPLIAAAVFILISVVSFLFVWLINRSMSRRLRQIVSVTEKIGNGQFDQSLEETGGDEFGQIAEAVNNMSDQIEGLIRDNYERQLKIKTSEMNLLQEQINPHFLYNALAVVSSLSIREGGKQTVQSIRYLADFYRASLSKGRQVITVEEELSILENYMKIQKLRFSDTLEISYDIDPDIRQCKTIKLILQPLVENAIHHGRCEDKVLHILVRGGSTGDRVYFEVQDDGAGIEPERLEKLNRELKTQQEGFGLRNVDIRIKLHYGQEYGVDIKSQVGKGTQIRVEIPRDTE